MTRFICCVFLGFTISYSVATEMKNKTRGFYEHTVCFWPDLSLGSNTNIITTKLYATSDLKELLNVMKTGKKKLK